MSSLHESKMSVFSISAPVREQLALRRCRVAPHTSPSSIGRERCAAWLNRIWTWLEFRKMKPRSCSRRRKHFSAGPERVAGRSGLRAHVEPWDLVYFDPPYATDYLGVLKLFGGNAGALLAEGGCLIVEHHHKNALPDEIGSIRRQRVLKQGDSALSFYEVVESS